MVAVPPVMLVFDISALSAATPSEWREFSRVGSCYVPQVVYEEMKLKFDRSPDPDLERIAKAFNRFYATSGWRITDVSGHHAALKVGSGQALTRRSRVSLAVGRCAYGLAENTPGSLVVLVTKDRPLLQRLYEIPAVNLCGITVDNLLQWSRTGQRPIAVSQKLQQFRAAHGIQPVGTTGTSQTYQRTSPTRLTAKPTSSKTKTSNISTPDWLPDVVSLLLATAGLAVAGYLIWLVFRNGTIQQFFENPTGQSSNPAPNQVSAQAASQSPTNIDRTKKITLT
ncbi:hypothetical protein HJG54_19120 [Leptolyngbya sp. NK1-12]|uniref:PIN domain-containing protein n=1 Tax=Leptolyngbya sp. NK1-12 TaxID=2547451 RepID=A0AA96WGQ3_9CYAN|nr:PIN domain-containing protein [Leptolyngbya sp. NK1-12]WNZ24745.1 hypothetical protein HJG54_19120 [Leptolyngbya sp. NK1-12]